MATPEMLTVGEVARRMRVSTRTVRRWVKGNYLAHIRVNGTIRILEEDLNSLISNKESRRAGAK